MQFTHVLTRCQVFCGGGENRPSWSWLVQSYNSLGRKYRKNLKALYLVHSTWWVRVMFEVMSNIISPKFARKVRHIDTLSELAQHTSFLEIDVPPRVYEHNLQFENAVRLPQDKYTVRPLFAVPLADLMRSTHGPVMPRRLEMIFAYLRRRAPNERGIFRLSPSSRLLEQAKQAIDRGNRLSLHDYGPHIAAGLLRHFLRDLPEPLFPRRLATYHTFEQSASRMYGADLDTQRDCIINGILPLLGPAELVIFRNVIQLLHLISAKAQHNRMDAANLVTCVSPLLISHPTDPVKDVSAASSGTGGLGMCMMACILHPDMLFSPHDNPDGVDKENQQPKLPLEELVSDPVVRRSPAKMSPAKVPQRSVSLFPPTTQAFRSDLLTRPPPLPSIVPGEMPQLRSVSPERRPSTQPEPPQPYVLQRLAQQNGGDSAIGVVEGLRTIFEERSRIACAAATKASSHRSVSG